MAYRLDVNSNEGQELVIDGWEKGIAQSPYLGISNIRNLNTSYYPGVVYVNYRRQACTLAATGLFYAGVHSVDEGNNNNWIFTAQVSPPVMTNPVSKAISPTGLIYIQDDTGQIWKQSAVNSTTFNILEGGTGRKGDGASGIAYWQNYLVVFGNGLIEFCGDGSGDAGIISTNWNYGGTTVGQQSSVFTTNWQPSQPSPFVTPFPYYIGTLLSFSVGSPIRFTTTGILPAPLALNTTYYIEKIVNGTQFYVSTVVTDPSLISTYNTGQTSMQLNTTWSGTTGNYMITFSNGDNRSTTLTNGSAAFTVSAISSGVSATISVSLMLTDNGTGTHTMSLVYSILPLGNYTSLQLSFSGIGATSGTIVSYVDPLGNTISGIWLGATGLYNIIMTGGQVVPANFTNNSATVSFLSPLIYVGYGSDWQVQLLNPTVTNYKPYVSKVDGSLYFANGQFIGRLAITSSPNITFNPVIGDSYSVSNGVTALPEQFTDTVVDMVDLKNQLVIAGQKDIYTWDYLSASTSSPSPVAEPIVSITNLLNNIYILAGQKGNIYVSNGYSAQLLTKLPDYIAGIFDPIWSFGGLMTHRSRLYFQALAKTTAGVNILAGIFSLMVSPSQMGEVASGLVMEAQNSYGLTPASGASGTGLLIDASPSSLGQDSYYSAWSNGTSLGGIDYNDTSLWQNYEPLIETDIIPIGNILEKGTMGQIQFKLDRPLASGDFIKLYWRPSLSDSYTLMGTTSTAQLSEYFNSNITQSQWAQFKVTFKCASSGSSFIPLREIRIQMT